MFRRILSRLSPRPIAYLTVGVLIGAGGSYALAATSTKTITACADKRTGVLHLKQRGRCARAQTRVTWNQRGPQGPAGAPAVKLWAVVDGAGVVGFGSGQGLSVKRGSPGTYQVTAPSCAHASDAPVVTVSDGYPPAGYGPGAFAIAWAELVGPGNFTVYTGVVAGGTFTPTDHTFDIQDICS